MRIIAANVAGKLQSAVAVLTLSASAAVAQSDGSQQQENSLPVVKLSPTVREVPVDPYAELPCRSLHSVSPQTESQRAALRRRAKTCLQAHDAFLPEGRALGAP